MHWLLDLFRVESVAQIAVILGLVVGAGLALGSIRIKSIGLGIAGVLFTGLLAGHILHRYNIELNTQTIEFTREFGLILFVYTIGIQVGPGFLASLRKQGLPLNLMAAGIVLLSVGITILIWKFGGVKIPVAVGLLCGATTNTPSLAAAQQALKDLKSTVPNDLTMPGIGYAIAYPFGILGIIVSMILIRVVFRINPQSEGDALAKLMDRDKSKLSGVRRPAKTGRR